MDEKKNYVCVTPVPGAAAGAGPFLVEQPKGDLNFTVYPSQKDDPGVFAAPLGIGKKDLAIRVHEYGHLTLIRKRIHTDDLMAALNSHSIDNSWVQAGLDVIVNSYLAKKECGEIRDLPLIDRYKKKYERSVAAQIFLRASHLKNQIGIRAALFCTFSLFPTDYFFLRKAAKLLEKWGRGEYIPQDECVKILQGLQNRFGIPEVCSPVASEGCYFSSQLQKGQKSSPRPLVHQSVLYAIYNFMCRVEQEMNDDGAMIQYKREPFDPTHLPQRITLNTQWGKMRIIKFPFSRVHPSSAGKRGIQAGYAGPFRFSHRALLPSGDGMAFAYRRKHKGGSVLLDCSGSMPISYDHIIRLLRYSPYATIAYYAGDKGNKTGTLLIAAYRGRMIEEKYLKHWFVKKSYGNVVDGYALLWLLNQDAPRIWVSDGVVTGIHDVSCSSLIEESKNICRRGEIKRYRLIETYLNSFQKKKT